jgi:glycosyltransferase involved in cell wall biosynthesis
MPDPVDLSLVIPVYNERDNLAPLIGEIERALVGRRFEIVTVDDGSTDGSLQALKDLKRAHPALHIVSFAANAGQTAAFAAGFQAARAPVIVTLDADGQNDPSSIPDLLTALEHADVVSGVRTPRADSWRRRVSSSVANTVRRAAIGDTIRDVGCSLKAYRREALEGIPLFVGAHRFLPALCQFRGARVAEIPVRHRPRRHGVSKYGVGNRLFRGIRDLFGVRWLKARMLRPTIRRVTHE